MSALYGAVSQASYTSTYKLVSSCRCKNKRCTSETPLAMLLSQGPATRPVPALKEFSAAHGRGVCLWKGLGAPAVIDGSLGRLSLHTAVAAAAGALRPGPPSLSVEYDDHRIIERRSHELKRLTRQFNEVVARPSRYDSEALRSWLPQGGPGACCPKRRVLHTRS